ncbi:MAG: FkbM family methyltransferase [Methylobacterium frigidaeris]
MKQIGDFFFPDQEKHFQKFASNIQEYQKEQREYAFGFVDDWSCAIDVGANVGIFSRDFATRFKKVVAIEPLRDNVECLSKNVPSNVEVLSFAAGDREGRCDIVLTNKTLGNAHIADTSGTGQGQTDTKNQNTESVDIRTIDSLNLESVGLIKIDVQGAELMVLRGAVETIKRCRPVLMIEEKAQGDAIRLLAEAGNMLESLGMTPMNRVGADRIFIFLNGRDIVVPKRPRHLAEYDDQKDRNYPVAPTVFAIGKFEPRWVETDTFYTPTGGKSYPKHHCKLTFMASKPFIKSYHNAIDVGCRDGEYARYLQSCFEHVYGFDPRRRDAFAYNVDLQRATHFNCALGDVPGTITMYGGTHVARDVEATAVQCLTLDSFGFERVSYIKVDVEGFEEKVLRGGQETIRRDRPVIVIEQNNATLAGAEKFGAKRWLEQHGYGHVATCPRGWDYVMAPV